MKEIKDILKQKPVYLNSWSGLVDMVGDFEDIYLTEKEYKAKECPIPNVEYWVEKKAKMKLALKKYKDIQVLFAAYNTANYSGDAFVLFYKDGQLFEVNGSHCSCMGLEGQWEPEITTLEAIEHRLTKGYMGQDDYSENEYADELAEFLGVNLPIKD